ncbi:hypothetical protein Rhopal_001720-T1 [Rhodotorula paludigena]|uniref:Uncharacterized protein n=1 Tax=Rhodotorula paludigena TaxID=86838 RepID=A0AAV5GHC6_9BASI|nr:hypothetical protein Rhopal_001720-T1 [Rhodotorula paludigena]
MSSTKGTDKEKVAMISSAIMPTWCAAEAAGHTLGSFKHNLITSQEEAELKYLQKKRKMQESLAGRRRSN